MNYYDDYPQLDLLASGDSAQETAERLLDLIGWSFSTKETKRKPIARSFEVLGVVFNFEECKLQKIIVTNKETRVRQIVEELDLILDTGNLTAQRAASLRGKLQFAETHTYGRALSANLRSFQDRALGKLPGTGLSEELKSELIWAKNFVKLSRPRTLHAGMTHKKLIVFTDAALEDNDNTGSIGMVAYVVSNGEVVEGFYFSARVPEYLLKAWQSKTRKVIATLELFAAVHAVEILSPMFQGWRFFLYVDNEAARACLISLYSRVTMHNVMLKQISEIVAVNSLFIWVARVPSASNPADKPSRNDTTDLLGEIFQKLDVQWPKAQVT